MKAVAIVFTSKSGQTEKIAKYLAAKLSEQNISNRLINSARESLESAEDFAGVIFGAPVYRGKFPKSVALWAKANMSRIGGISSACFTVTLNAADKRPEARVVDSQLREQFMRECDLATNVSASFAGALKYRSYWWPVRLLMKHISAKAGGDTDTSRDFEYTDWKQVDNFLDNFLSQLQSKEKWTYSSNRSTMIN